MSLKCLLSQYVIPRSSYDYLNFHGKEALTNGSCIPLMLWSIFNWITHSNITTKTQTSRRLSKRFSPSQIQLRHRHWKTNEKATVASASKPLKRQQTTLHERPNLVIDPPSNIYDFFVVFVCHRKCRGLEKLKNSVKDARSSWLIAQSMFIRRL